MRDEQARASALERRADGNHRRSPGMHGLDDLGVIDALEIHGGDAEVAVAELALNDHERDALVRELDRVCMAELVGSEAEPDASRRSGVAQLRASGRNRPAPAARRTANNAEERANRELQPGGQPRLQLLPGPVVHADLAAPAALATAHQHGTSARVED